MNEWMSQQTGQGKRMVKNNQQLFLPLTKLHFQTAQKSYQLSSVRTASGCRRQKIHRLIRKLDIFNITKVQFSWNQRAVWNSPTVRYAGVGLIVSNYPLLSLWTPNIHLQQHNTPSLYHRVYIKCKNSSGQSKDPLCSWKDSFLCSQSDTLVT